MIGKILRIPARTTKKWTLRDVLKFSQLNSSTKNDTETKEKPLVPLMEFHGNWPDDVKRKFLSDMTVIENFVSPDEEADILKEVEPYLKRMRYEVDHWDDAIQGFRETERKSWYPQNKEIISRVLSTAFPDTSKTLPHIHVLDLEATGFIKPHVDSVRFCGTTISGISLLSDSIMRLVQTTEDHSASTDYRNQPSAESAKDGNLYSVKILLRRYSLYIMSHTARYNFTHEILNNEESFISNHQIQKNRRISIMCRNEP